MSNVTELNENTFSEFIRTAELPVIVDFWADWCAPCQMLLPIIDQAAEALEGEVLFAKVNTQQAPAVGFQYAIRTIPTLILFYQGQELDRKAGVLSLVQIKKWLADHRLNNSSGQ